MSIAKLKWIIGRGHLRFGEEEIFKHISSHIINLKKEKLHYN